MDLTEIWRNALGEIQVTISKPNFETWFKNTFIFEYKKGVFTIGVPTFFVEGWLRTKHLKDIMKALQKQCKETVTAVKFKIASPKPEQIIAISNNKVIHKPVDKPASKTPQIQPQPLPPNSSLNEKYIFENFVVGGSNQLAHAAAMSICDQLGEKYNPLYIYGEPGVGKTHLMQAVGHETLRRDPSKKVLYVSSEDFVNDFIQAVSSGLGKANDFKNRYRRVDLLLIDDIQFLGTKEQTQDEFFHTFNHLHQNKKQVILTSDRPPKEIGGLEQRLQSRFEGGMVTDIGTPDLETRQAILNKRANQLNKEIDSEVIELIATNITSSIRELEGALNKIIAISEMSNTPPNITKTLEILGDIVKEKQTAITPDLVIKEISKYYRIPITDLLGRRRTKELVLPRQITMYLLRHEVNKSYPEIGREMGGKDHSTIMHGVEKIEACLSTDTKLKNDLSILKDKIFSSYR